MAAVDRDRLVATAADLVAVSSPTGREEPAADLLLDMLADAGCSVTKQEIEPDRANAVGRVRGRRRRGRGPTLMFNGHLDTSYTGEEPWLDAPGFKPEPVVRDDAILGLGIMNMKGAVACYVEAVRALGDAGIRLKGDLIVAGVAGEIETAEWGEFQGPSFRGYGTGTKHLVSQGVSADAAVLGEPTEERLVLGHYGTMWARISTNGPFFHTAFSEGRIEENSLVRMHRLLDEVVAWVGHWEEKGAYRDLVGVVNLGAIRGGFPWRVSRTPHRTDLFLDIRVPPNMEFAEAKGELAALVDQLRKSHPGYDIEWEVYVTAGGAELPPEHPVVLAADAAHRAVTGETPQRAHVHWASDASTLSRAGIPSLNYGPISGALPGPEGESVPIASLVRMSASYALLAAQFCGVDI
jgi:acetylornithine deacetylase